MKLKTRQLKVDEIRPKACKANKGGVRILLWKTPLADLNVLEEALDPGDFQVTYPRPDTCRISIWDAKKQEWVAKEGIGEGISAKNTANDALNRAGTAWGIGRELFTEQELFVYKDKLKTWKENPPVEEGGRVSYSCEDEFTVQEITYEDGKISYLKLGILQYGKLHNTVEFKLSQRAGSPTGEKKQENTPAPVTPATKETAAEPGSMAAPVEVPAQGATPMAAPTTTGSSPLADDEIILLGNCRGKKYGEVKDTPVFKSFLKWAKRSSTRYDSPAAQEQFDRLKILAEAV